jgi:hypothetical protein
MTFPARRRCAAGWRGCGRGRAAGSPAGGPPPVHCAPGRPGRRSDGRTVRVPVGAIGFSNGHRPGRPSFVAASPSPAARDGMWAAEAATPAPSRERLRQAPRPPGTSERSAVVRHRPVRSGQRLMLFTAVHGRTPSCGPHCCTGCCTTSCRARCPPGRLPDAGPERWPGPSRVRSAPGEPPGSTVLVFGRDEGVSAMLPPRLERRAGLGAEPGAPSAPTGRPWPPPRAPPRPATSRTA